MSSFGKATRGKSLNKSSLMPGPGNYISENRRSTPSFSIGKSQRSGARDNNGPGPGQYQALLGGSRGVSIGQKSNYGSVMAGLGKNGGNPGPGHYQSGNYDSRSAAYSFGIKTGSALDNGKHLGVPGPGQYNLGGSQTDHLGKSSHNTSRGPGFGTEKRAIGGVTKSSNEIPGPGQYTIDSWGHAPRIGFGTSTREKNGGLSSKESKLVPGPGQYSYEEIIGKNATKVSMKFRPNTSSGARTLDAPGPGQYNPNVSSIKTAVPGSRMGTSQRSGLTNNAQNMPGPGHHTISDDWTGKFKNAGFGASQRNGLSLSRDGPGPGNYNPNEITLSAAPQYSMGGGRLKSAAKSNRNQVPGPGQYNPRVDYSKENLGGVKIGTSPRGEKYARDLNYLKNFIQYLLNKIGNQMFQDGPGPGNYNVQNRLGGPSYGIGSGSRSNAKHDQTPGPGQYKLPVYVASLPRYQMPDKPESLRYV